MGSQISPDTPTIALPQGKLVGVKLNDSLPQAVDSWMGVPYALPPTGDLRFRLPVKVPASPDKVIDASEYGPAAPGKGLLVGPTLEQSEDCLTVNIFRKSADKHEKLPVALYIHGGAFNRGSAHMHKTASMVANAPEAFVAVTFQYRIGALGFLPSSLSAKEGVLNLGLKDQILMMEWVQENIAAFGGDPSNVTLFGLSAGAHSIGHHIMHYKEGVAPLFHKAIIESGAPTSRAVRPYNAPIHEAQFKDFLRAVGVPEDLPECEIFPYLRQQPEKVITDAQTATFDKYNPSLRWAFQPVIDGEVIARPPLETWKSGKWHKVPIITGFTTNEGSLYVNKQMSESSQFRHFWAELLPLLTSEDLDTIEELYRDPAKFENSEYKETRKGMGSQYKRIEAAYAHYAYVAPARQTAELASPSVPVYLYHWAAVSTVNNGAQHADNMRYEVCDPKVVAVSETQKDLAKTLNHYVTSFITRGDPNAVSGEYPQRPRWEAYDPKSPKVLRFGEGNEELIGGDAGKTAVFTDDDWARKQSEFWWSKVDISQQ
ncbi:triacylglycerol lipase [Fusarium verticillioides 7600]|uniref:Carboxylic ester hydrolase n=1 Tax=Gibberella moniliformis (strain M3125 / FGSC 7600) TaxID=334819 RepID=W7MLY1_GIBM7|nr:triacylglycerol lipase [Fusarium verticillioides 7600]EWG52091.1 triacylglycerol lipase [Fusarium verticillioides 7600]